MVDDDNLVWIDLEMTGLNPFTDRILEVATVITNSELDILADGPVIAIQQPEEVLARMDKWNRDHHRHSGLLDRVRQSTYSCPQAEMETLAFVRQWARDRVSPMCGNSVWHDRRFLARYMPELEIFFHYRNIDVSTLKELALRWAPDLANFNKECHHLALEDIRESIAELKHYSNSFIRRK
ncbi:oligoribonuclease [Desulfobulbus alkaliphilus]|uniref:oligoribonuclease n=1 Tax=Desulfobulbus alkaliphilus TaxID=869814 RepID=UPI00196690BF|nr:oligoribonuclease [Desulfobulbus alkaliphilus]MBM9535946.1 oligoribonuclease [Desulfobulbus alkaliphilus]